ncbi:MAG TPA: hypothetical protein VIN08_17455 [Ohtaekwangia sp.]|uniref:hypothetical protein n=1 Tax=Ohtaekwangia sp. TaxID=2066019 RepID=UPI002F934B59
MKNLLLLMLTLLLQGIATENLFAQQTGDKEKMNAFINWIGRWQGESTMQMGPNETRKAVMDERIESRLEGTVLLVEGLGKAFNTQTKQDMIVHHALAILSYDKWTKQYKLRSYLNDGNSTDAWVNVTGENTFQWGFDIPGRGKMRYSIVLDPVKKTWDETGEFSPDGAKWNNFFSMHLTKTE